VRGMKKFFLTTIVLIVVLALAVFGTVWALNHFSGGLPFSQRCTATASAVGSHNLAPDQADNAALISAISLQRDLPARAATIGIATAMQESKLRNIDYGDRDSLGLFQQRPSQGWGTEEQVQDPRYATEAFYDVLARIKGYDDMPVTDAAQAVQRSAFPDAYAQHEDMARAFASALTGNSPAALDCRLHEADTGDLAGFSTRFAADFSDLEARPVNREGGDAALAGQKQIAVSIPDDADAGADGGDAEADDAGAGAAGEDTQPDGADKQPDVRMWAVANWAVAVADSYGIVAVDAGGQQWTRDEPWAPSDVPEAGNVLITFAPQDAD